MQHNVGVVINNNDCALGCVLLAKAADFIAGKLYQLLMEQALNKPKILMPASAAGKRCWLSVIVCLLKIVW